MTETKVLEIPDDIELHGRLSMRSGSKTIMQFYLERIAAGVTPKLAEALAMQQAPGIGITTAVFLQDQRRHGTSILDQYKGDHRQVEELRRGLARNGYKLKADDQYIATAARPGMSSDPLAIVNETQDFESLQKRNAERQAREQEQPAEVKQRLAPRIVERIRQQRIKQNPDLARTDQRELREEIISKHGTKAKVL